MTTEWLYRATESRATLAQTKLLLEKYRFIARSAYTVGTPKQASQKTPNVWPVKLGHVLHVYYRTSDGVLHPLQAWRVAVGGKPTYSGFVQGSGLVRVAKPEFRDAWCGEGKPYDVDPVLKVLTGWALETSDLPSPAIDHPAFGEPHWTVRPK